MVRRNKDSKFVIYQVLYIFVITVLAIKGANLDLGEVIAKDKAVKTSVRDSLLTVIDSLNSLGLKFNLTVQQDYKVENLELKKKLEKLNQSVVSLSQKVRETPGSPQRMEEKPASMQLVSINKKEEALLQSPLSESQSFIQNTWNIAKNSGNIPAQIVDANTKAVLTTVSPGEQKKFDLTNQNEVIVRFGSREQRIPVTPRRPPEIHIEPVSSKMNGSEIFVQDLQRTTVFKVTVLDLRPDQLQINYNGPVSVSGPFKDSKGNLVYNVSLKIAADEQKFDDWMNRTQPLKDGQGRYKVNFFFVAQDTRTKARVQVGDTFYFTDFQR